MPWRPMAQQVGSTNPAQHHLISVATIDGTNKAQLMQIAQHNAQIMRKLKGVTSNQQPMSSTQQFFNNYQSSTPSYHQRYAVENSKQQQFLGKQDYQNFLKITSTAPKIQHLSNNKHQFSGSNYRLLNSTPNFRNEVSLTPPPLPPHSTQKAQSTQKQHPVINKLQAHLALAQLQQHSAKQPSAEQSARHENFILPSSILNSFSKFAQPAHFRGDFSKGKTQNYIENEFKNFKVPSGMSTTKNYYGNQYLPPTSNLTAENFVLQNLPIHSVNTKSPFKFSFQSTHSDHHQGGVAAGGTGAGGFVSHGIFPSIPPSVLSPFFQQVQQQQSENTGHKSIDDYLAAVTPKTEINDEFTRHLVPPPPSYKTHTHDDHELKKQTAEIFNKYVPSFAQQDANRYVYNTGSLNSQQNSKPESPSTTESPTYSGYLFPPSTDPPLNFVSYSTTNKPIVFKALNQSAENPFKQHKLLHPSYTGAKRPTEQSPQQQPQQQQQPKVQHTQTVVHHQQQPQQQNYQGSSQTTFLPTPYVPEANSAITHAFFTIEDAVTLSPQSVGSLNLHSGDGKHHHQPQQQPIIFNPTKNYEYEIDFGQQNSISTESPDIFHDKQRYHEDKLLLSAQKNAESNGYDSYVISSTAQPTTSRPFYTTTFASTTTTTQAPPPPPSSSPTFNSIQPQDKIKMRRRRPKPAHVTSSVRHVYPEESYPPSTQAPPPPPPPPRNQDRTRNQPPRGNQRPLRNRRPVKPAQEQAEEQAPTPPGSRQSSVS